MPIHFHLAPELTVDNRTRYLKLLNAHGITQAYSAVLINAVTQRPCSARAVRSWLNDPDKPSARPCPMWAVEALEKGIGYMQRAVSRRSEGVSS